ncbi:hypothetical protein B9Z55_004996 [Caenorhabditis nigoni]|uniref:Uncharacterized protein n=1 Tax=Caenorhabditis nigoni TaxID=1611254 RepID=A0A2G5UZ05_9PELO|nr:hypothetical protein B9Z55_004996 [Caenorhabditis nigoni]
MGSGILVGDLLQLTVGQDRVYHSNLWYKFQRVELCENIRAKGDQIHIDHLEKWRNGIINEDDLHFLKEREICPNGLEKKIVAEKFIGLGDSGRI